MYSLRNHDVVMMTSNHAISVGVCIALEKLLMRVITNLVLIKVLKTSKGRRLRSMASNAKERREYLINWATIEEGDTPGLHRDLKVNTNFYIMIHSPNGIYCDLNYFTPLMWFLPHGKHCKFPVRTHPPLFSLYPKSLVKKPVIPDIKHVLITL